MKPRLLDLFCKAGGCTKGYQRAGFYVVGVDIEAQRNYCGDEFIQADALRILNALAFGFDELAPRGFRRHRFDAIHASPPCQFSVSLSRLRGAKPHENLIPETRRLLIEVGLPYVIENVPASAKHMRNPVTICGYGLGLPIKRHRLFECSFPVMSSPCRHDWPGGRPVAVHGQTGGWSTRNRQRGWSHAERSEAMGIDWMTNDELTQAIPPVYTEHIGHYLMAEIRARRAVA